MIVATSRPCWFLARALILGTLALCQPTYLWAAEPPVDADAGVEEMPSTPAGDAGTVESKAPDSIAPSADTKQEPPPPPRAASTSSGAGLFEESLSTAPPATTAQAPTAADEPAYDLGGYVRGDLFVGKVPGFSQAEIKAGYGELALELKLRKERYGDAYAEARLRYGQQGDNRALFVDLREAYVNAYLGPVDLRLGHQIVVWGRADAFNPTNNLTPFDLRIRSPSEDDRRLANVGARVFVTFAPLRLEGVWMPIYAPAEVPAIAPTYVTLSEPDFPPPELEKGLGAARLHLELPAFEASVSYLHGYAPLPGLRLRGFTAGIDPPEVRVLRAAYNHHVAGLDFSTAIGDVLGLRGEAAYRHPLDYENREYAPRPDLQYVLGVDRTFGSVNVIAQYMGRYVFDWQREEGPADPIDPAALSGFDPPLPPFLEAAINASINRELAVRNQIIFAQTAKVQHLASLRIEWLTLEDTLSLSALGLVNVTTREWLVYPKLGYEISDSMSTAFGAEIYAGPDGTLFGLIDEALSAAYAELRFGF